MKRLIVNADDFGLTPGVNRAIIECHQRGIVTSTTLMANSKAFDDAMRLAESNPVLGVGCHVTLLDCEPILPRKQVSSLLKDGRDFFQSITDFAPRAVAGRFSAEEIEAEATAQFQKLQSAGISITHFDSHKHAHMFPAVFEPLLKAAKKCGIGAVRNPFEPPFALSPARFLGNRKLAVRSAEVALLRVFRNRWLSLVRKHGFVTTDASLGLAATGSLDSPSLRELLRGMGPGTYELVCHPGYNDGDLDEVKTILRTSREVERDALIAAQKEQWKELSDVELGSFAKIVSPVPSVAG